MYIHVMASLDIKYNLAFEECIMNSWTNKEPILLLWQSESALVIGKHQNAYEEVNSQFVYDQKVPVVRRNSGGGTVYHDLGNLNYSIIASFDKFQPIDWHKLYKPIIDALKNLGLDIDVSKRHDLKIDGRKISGTAQFRKKCNVLHHGTLLFNSSLNTLVRSLELHGDKEASSGFQSVRSKVVNIYDYLEECESMSDFKLAFIDALAQNVRLKYWVYEPNYANEISELVKDKYDNWDWNYGRSKVYQVKYSTVIDGENINVMIKTKKCIIEELIIDTSSYSILKSVEMQLVGKRYERSVVLNALKEMKLNITEDFINIFTNLIMGFY